MEAEILWGNTRVCVKSPLLTAQKLEYRRSVQKLAVIPVRHLSLISRPDYCWTILIPREVGVRHHFLIAVKLEYPTAVKIGQ
jgi:hypothetical protein